MTTETDYENLVAKQLWNANNKIQELEKCIQDLLEFIDSDSLLDARTDEGVHLYWTPQIENLRKLIKTYDK